MTGCGSSASARPPTSACPAESKGILTPADQWDGRQQYTVLFGQGVAQSTLQTVRAYQSIANDGVMLQPRLIDSYINPDGTEEKVPAKAPQQVVSKDTAKQVRDILESAVTEGEIKEAAIDGYRVGAKTGTSESPCDDGKSGFCGYTASIIGMAPMDDPRFIVEVVLQRPKGSIYGITNGPVFRSVMSQTLRTFNVQPSTGEPAGCRSTPSSARSTRHPEVTSRRHTQCLRAGACLRAQVPISSARFIPVPDQQCPIH